jgi:DNA-binding NtrC family response regulator
VKEKKKILIVDDEPNIRRILQVAFEKEGYFPFTAEDAFRAMEIVQSEPMDCVITDVTMPGKTGYELLHDLKSYREDLPVVVMTAFGTIPQAIQAIRDGAFEYVTKPFDLESLKKIVASSLGTHSSAGVSPAKRLAKTKDKGSFLAASPAMQEVLATVQQVADSRATVLVTGESGVGKEVVARAVHNLSSRSSNPFVAVSCAALPETLLESELFGYEKGAFTGAQGAKAGRFETANTGTLFLDEIGEIPMSVQVKLLRVLQEREFERLGSNKPTKVDVRVITATNRPLQEAVDQGVFRLDLLYRLQVVEINIPPLRERTEDIEPLANLFLAKYSQENDRDQLLVGQAALKLLHAYSWPGNVRELENVMERAVVLSSPSDEELIPRLLPSSLQKAA